MKRSDLKWSDLITVKQAAEARGQTPANIRKYLAQGRIEEAIKANGWLLHKNYTIRKKRKGDGK